MAYTTPSANYYQQVTRDTSQGQFAGNQLLGQLGAQIAPTMGIAGMQASGVQTQLGLLPQETNLSNAYQSAMTGYGLGQLGIHATQLGVQGLGLSQEQSLYNTLNPLEQQEFATRMTQFPEEYAQAALQHRTQLTNFQAQNAQQGAQGSVGQQQALTTLQQNYGFQLQNIGRAQQLAQMQQQGTLAQQQYSTEQLANSRKNLTLLAKSNGLSQQELMTRLNYGLQNNQFGEINTIVHLMTRLGGIWSGAANTAAATAGLAGYVNGVNLYAPSAMTMSRNTLQMREIMSQNPTYTYMG